ncbi:MAG: hypothetical protein QXJ28_01235 [Candidatus Pacearchaeota archaeon]
MGLESTNKSFRCEKCKDTGMVKDKDGTVHTCWDCLNSDKLDQHSKRITDSNIRA